jgi:hypothetical protein
MAHQDDACFFTISNEAYFPGVVALINSLVLTGHDYPIVVGDCGLTEQQQAVLLGYGRCRLFKLDPNMVQNPLQYKAFAHLAHADGVAVIIDSDMIVTGSLEPIIERARNGKLCAFANPGDRRWFSEWQDIFGLSTAPRRQTYICTGFQAFSVSHWPKLLEQWWNACRAIHSHPTYQETGDMSLPTAQGDQDALNALLMSEYPSEAVFLERFDGQVHRLSLRDVKTLDVGTLACEFQGDRPLILHASCMPKPWMRKGAARNTYFVFLHRLLTGPDLQIRPPASMLDGFLSPGVSGWILRHRQFLSNMGLIALAISYCPHRFKMAARQAKATMKQQLAQWRQPVRGRRSV